MSRSNKLMLIVVLIVFTLACNAITQPIQDAQEAVDDVQEFATFATTIEAMATMLPGEGTPFMVMTEVSGVANLFNPQGEPVAEWNGIPVMPQATAGQEFDAQNYSFKYTGEVKEAADFYADALGNAGWSPMVTTSDPQGAVLVYSQGDKFLTITVSPVNGEVIVILSVT